MSFSIARDQIAVALVALRLATIQRTTLTKKHFNSHVIPPPFSKAQVIVGITSNAVAWSYGADSLEVSWLNSPPLDDKKIDAT